MKKLILTAITGSILIPNIIGCSSKNSAFEDTNIADSQLEQTVIETEESKSISQANLQTYDETSAGIPVKAQYPQTMEVSGMGSGEGVGVFFKFKPQDKVLEEAEVHFFLPAGGKTAAEIEPFVTGPNGLMANNGWTLVKEAQPPQDLMYPWVKEIITFSTAQEMEGHILLGEIEGQALQVTLLYPREMADNYWSAAKTVLDSVEFDPNLLPIKSSEDELALETSSERSAYEELPLPEDNTLVGVEPEKIALDIFGISEPVEGNFQEKVSLADSSDDLTIVTLTQTGLPDDSIEGMRYRLEFKPDEDQWRLNWVGRQLRCYSGRGSQVWGIENCR